MTGLPGTLLRFFKKEEYARQFIAGAARFGLLEHYRTIEGARQDDKEGLVSFSWNARSESGQNIHYSGISLNRYYIMSTSHPDADVSRLAHRFGRFVVRIADPMILLERIKAVWRDHPLALTESGLWAPVVYDKCAHSLRF